MPEDRAVALAAAGAVVATASITVPGQVRSAGSPTPITSGPLSIIAGRPQPSATDAGRVHALWRRVLAGLVVCDPDPRYSVLDRLDGLVVSGSARAVRKIHAPVDGQ